MVRTSRRTFLLGTGASLAATVGTRSRPASARQRDDGAVPLANEQLLVEYPLKRLRNEVVSGGPPKDGIPSIDDPKFTGVADADERLQPGDIVFGVAKGDDVKAYPQYILVWHEITNDTLDGTPVSVTYCPLTGTALGFERGETTFGVSGDLLNNNLVMYDRATDSRWPQMLGTAIEGAHEGESLREFRLVWTTWEQWKRRHPETEVLSEDTGYIRDYGGDTYGTYNPRGGYYTSSNTLFDRLQNDDRYPLKKVVLGARTPTDATAFVEDALRKRGLVEGQLGDSPVVAVYDSALDTAYIYRTPDSASINRKNGAVAVNGSTYSPADLPLDRVYGYDAMWFAWVGMYPNTGVHD
ncbi:DUF3179 domain-containing protein [Halorussus aquaticus]|uniref:DUF3179 domain-containing protein n=1 Tax=Halorussus aquaticus TaxID=2953748 RepID=A0ABD5Q858_9EURY|nr:DUF3179 domain-containing protein [Halorussus aquaticus]